MTITTSDTPVGTDAVGALGAEGTSNESISVTAPSAFGTYYYGACVNAVTGESDTTNNCSSAVTVRLHRPDRVVHSPTASPSNPVGRNEIHLFGDDEEHGWWSVGGHDYAVLPLDRTRRGTRRWARQTVGALDPGGTSRVSISLTALSRPGTYDYRACVDAVPSEADASNNCSSYVTVTVLPKVDLVVGSPTVSNWAPVAGTAFTLSATVSNTGNGASASTTLRYYRSTDATITISDTSEGTGAVGALAPAGTSDKSISVTATSIPGIYYYGDCVNTVASEPDTTNNCSSSVRVTVLSSSPVTDLVVGSPTVSAGRPVVGASFTLSATVINLGSGASTSTTLRYHRSTDSTITMSDTAVGTDAVGALAAAGTSVQSISLTVPATAGAYYYGACVDAVADESDTADNCSASVKVDVQTPQPSTRSVEVTAPQEWAPVGGTVTYAASVLDENGDEMSGYAFSWTSSDTSKATVDASGVVTAHAVGEVTIIATASATASATVKARPFARDFGTAASNSQSTLSGSLKMDVVKPVARIELSPSSLSFTEVGGDWETVTATLYDADNNEMTPTYWGWYSGDREVADVYSRVFGSVVSASVQSIGEGATTVTLSANGTTGSMNVTVTLPTARVNISPRSLTFEALGDTKSVTVWVLDENGDEDEDATFGYIGVFSPCCDPFLADPPKSIDIEEVDGGLEITAEGPGRGSYTISSPDVESAILLVTVYQNPATLEVSPSTASLEVDGTTTLSATIKDANGHSMHVDDGMGGLVVYWETSDSAVATVEGATATTDDNTGGSATVTAVAAGMATITGRWGSRSRGVIGTTTVTVTDSN